MYDKPVVAGYFVSSVDLSFADAAEMGFTD
jgi:hypothetical protein